ncbi:MAG: sulfite reductase subunit alpha [Verrucomicrobiota bacterium]
MSEQVYNKKNPFLAKVTENRLINKEGSKKETRHFVVDLEGSNLSYEPGYSLAVFAQNPPSVVEALIQRLNFPSDHPIEQRDGSTKTVEELFTSGLTLNRVGKKFIKGLAEKLDGEAKEKLTAIIEDAEKFEEYIFSRDYVDVLNEYADVSFTPEEFVGLCTQALPRLYSIASSIAKHPNEVHLTVAVVRWNTHDREKKGLATGWLADHQELNLNTLPVFLAPNKHFKIPQDPDTDIIMVGPGTGIAPFRAFLEQREVDKAPGRNWLFFGDWTRAYDFLYDDEFEAWEKSGLLTKLDTAFSRDQEKKIYVQHKIEENAEEIWQWLEGGAYFYVCGDAKRMAKDVEKTLIGIAAKYGNMSEEDATTYITKTLAREERRYLKDVY